MNDQKTSSSRYGERDGRYEELLQEMEKFRKLHEGGASVPATGGVFVLDNIPRGAKVLEFGPASGYMTRYLAEQLDCEVSIIEQDPDCAASAGEFSRRSFVGDIDSGDWVNWLEDERFDVMMFCDVLEHLYDPWQTLQMAQRFLNDDGMILCSIPNVAHHSIIATLLENRFEYMPMGLLDWTHIRFLTSCSIESMIAKAGLECDLTGHVIRKLLDPSVVAEGCPEIIQNITHDIQYVLSEKEQHAVFQYVFRLRKKSYLEAQRKSSYSLLGNTDRLTQEDLFKIASVRNEICRMKTVCVDQQKTIECLTQEKGILINQVNTLLQHPGIRFWNTWVRIACVFMPFKAWRRSVRNYLLIR